MSNGEIEIETNYKPPVKKKTATERARDRAFTAYRREFQRLYVVEPSFYHVRDDGLIVVDVNGRALPAMSLQRMKKLTRDMKAR